MGWLIIPARSTQVPTLGAEWHGKSYLPGSEFFTTFNGQRICILLRNSNVIRTIIFFQDIQKALSAFPYIQYLLIKFKIHISFCAWPVGFCNANSDLTLPLLWHPSMVLIHKFPARQVAANDDLNSPAQGKKWYLIPLCWLHNIVLSFSVLYFQRCKGYYGKVFLFYYWRAWF